MRTINKADNGKSIYFLPNPNGDNIITVTGLYMTKSGLIYSNNIEEKLFFKQLYNASVRTADMGVSMTERHFSYVYMDNSVDVLVYGRKIYDIIHDRITSHGDVFANDSPEFHIKLITITNYLNFDGCWFDDEYSLTANISYPTDTIENFMKRNNWKRYQKEILELCKKYDVKPPETVADKRRKKLERVLGTKTLKLTNSEFDMICDVLEKNNEQELLYKIKSI